MPVTGATQRLPRPLAAVRWPLRYVPLILGGVFTLLQARVWLWLWPLIQAASTNRAGDLHINLFYYAVVLAISATICISYRLTFRASLALVGLLVCWAIRALMG